MTDNGSVDKVKGKAKEVAGDVAGDNSTKAEGIMDQVVGKAKEMGSKAKDTAETLVDASKEKINDLKGDK